MKQCASFLWMVCTLIMVSWQSTSAQTIQEVMDSATLENQLIFVQEHTRIYDNFRAIREDVFQRMKKNAIDTLNGAKLEIATLNSELTERKVEIETLNTDLGRAKNERDQAIRTKDTFTLLGIEMNKGVYSTVLWIIILILALFGALMFVLFKRAHVVTSQTHKELEDLKQEYEEHKKNSREKYEKLVVSHHNEIMKLKRG
jgi:septal ring factor EnvC (AmiA/AmiB activator)